MIRRAPATRPARLAPLLLLALVGCTSAPQPTAMPPRPNVVLVLVDDLGWRDVSYAGEQGPRTPRIDRLAEQGMVFTSAYAAAPNCAPSRAALLSGQYAPRTGVYTVQSSARGKAAERALVPVRNRERLAPGVVTIAEVLGAAGYRCASIGKWHLGEGARTGPLGQGFHVNVGGNLAGHPRSYTSPWSNPDLRDGPEGEYLTTRLVDQAIAFVEGAREGPFFLYLAPYAVHTPLQPPPARLAALGERPTRRERYVAMVEGLDEELGRLLDALERLELEEDTLVVLTSDNGGLGGVSESAPLRGSKGMLHEGGVRVPLVVRWPGRVRPSSRCDEPVIGVDLFPTLAALCGARPPARQPLDGVDLTPLLLASGELGRDALFWHFPAYLEAGRALDVGPWRATPCSVVRAGRHKLIETFEDGRAELYDLETDPGEQRDLAGELPEVRDRLLARLRAWREELRAPLPEGAREASLAR